MTLRAVFCSGNADGLLIWRLCGSSKPRMPLVMYVCKVQKNTVQTKPSFCMCPAEDNISHKWNEMDQCWQLDPRFLRFLPIVSLFKYMLKNNYENMNWNKMLPRIKRSILKKSILFHRVWGTLSFVVEKERGFVKCLLLNQNLNVHQWIAWNVLLLLFILIEFVN